MIGRELVPARMAEIIEREKITYIMVVPGHLYPAEIERAMASIPAIEEIAVIGVPDDTWGERVVAMVYLAQPATRDEIYREMRALLGPMKAPKDIIILSERLPRTVTNKVARGKLPDLYRTLPKSQPANS